MADMPEVIYAGIVEDDYGRSEQVWEEDEGCLPNHGDILEAKPYLRADTCTTNERLEELICEIEQEIMSQAGPNDYGNAVRTMGKFVIKRLREVMK